MLVRSLTSGFYSWYRASMTSMNHLWTSWADLSRLILVASSRSSLFASKSESINEFFPSPFWGPRMHALHHAGCNVSLCSMRSRSSPAKPHCVVLISFTFSCQVGRGKGSQRPRRRPTKRRLRVVRLIKIITPRIRLNLCLDRRRDQTLLVETSSNFGDGQRQC